MSIETIQFGRSSGYRAGFRRRWPALFLIGALLAVLAWALARAHGARHFGLARELVRPMAEAGVADTAAAARADRALQRSMRWFPDHPDHLDLAGQLREVQAMQPGVVGRERAALLEEAAHYFRSAIRVRPRWPYSWASLLGVKSQLGQLDEEFDRALERAIVLGPREPGVRMRVLEVSLRHWQALGDAARQRAREQLAMLHEVRPSQVTRLLEQFVRADAVCPDESGTFAQDYCRRAASRDEAQ